MIDFEHARIGLQARDFTRLHFRYWASQPRLRDGFFDGYRRWLTAAEQQAVVHCGAIDALAPWHAARRPVIPRWFPTAAPPWRAFRDEG